MSLFSCSLFSFTFPVCAEELKSLLLTSDSACWSFIMQMMDKFEIYHTEHSVSDIYEWEDTAGK